jgi:hypothetical protein
LFLALLNERWMKRDSVEIIITTIVQSWWITRFQRWVIAIKKKSITKYIANFFYTE